MIVLYDLVSRDGRRFSPYCWRTRLALAHKGLPYKTAPCRFADISAIPGGEQKTVPVIEDGGRIVGDSWTIANYLEDAYSDRPSLFGGPSGRALTLFLQNWVVSVLHPGIVSLALPDMLTKGPAAGGIINVPAMAIIVVIMMALSAGVKQSARLNRVIVFAKLAAIAIFISVALFHIDTALWRPFMPFGWFSTGADGTNVGVLAAASLVFFAYRGFQNVSVTAEEALKPQRDVPIGIIASLTVCTAIYLAVSGLLTAIAPYDALNVPSPVAFSLLRLGYNWGSALVALGVIIGLTSTMLVLYYSLTRILFAMARDGLLPPFFSALDSKTHSPRNAILLSGIVLALAAGLVPLAPLAQLVNAGTLAEFMLVCVGVLVLRLTRPTMKRPFKAPGGAIIPVLGVLSCGALMSFLPLATLWRFALYLAAGVIVYFVYAARHRNTAAAGKSETFTA